MRIDLSVTEFKELCKSIQKRPKKLFKMMRQEIRGECCLQLADVPARFHTCLLEAKGTDLLSKQRGQIY